MSSKLFLLAWQEFIQHIVEFTVRNDYSRNLNDFYVLDSENCRNIMAKSMNQLQFSTFK